MTGHLVAALATALAVLFVPAARGALARRRRGRSLRDRQRLARWYGAADADTGTDDLDWVREGAKR